MTIAAAIQSLLDIAKFLFAGHAKFTLVSKKTGDRKTFEVRARDEHRDFFYVSLLVGPENTTDFRYVCCAFKSRQTGLWVLKQNKDHWGAEAFSAFVWLVAWVNAVAMKSSGDASRFFEQAEFWHAGVCSRCGRDLTDPESIARGLGPVCAEKE